MAQIKSSSIKNAYYCIAEVDGGAYAANVMVAIVTAGACQNTFSHHFIVIEGNDGYYYRFEIGGYSKHSNWSNAISTSAAIRKGKQYSYRSPKIHSVKYKDVSLSEMIQYTNTYSNKYGEYHEIKNNCQHFGRNFAIRFLITAGPFANIW